MRRPFIVPALNENGFYRPGDAVEPDRAQYDGRSNRMKNLFLSWQFWALLSAAFAALTAIFAKIGIENVNSDFATFIRTIVILAAAGLMVYVTGNWQQPSTISGRTWLFLVLSGLATGASWICYFRALKIGDAARVAPIDKLSVVFVAVFAVLFLGERLSLPNWSASC
ncbi:eamA-like transporter family domain-containing protein [Ditylenchus destructor]|nr:eamA-like transporter family domain-containing protein [Ditylenchus destructor]